MRLEQEEYLKILAKQHNFNSIKVRLERRSSVCCRLYRLRFQFHKGAIRTGFRCPGLVECLDFNSIKVRLEQFAVEAYHISSGNFNSIKVRLELLLPLGPSPTMTVFQFHKGAIRTDGCTKTDCEEAFISIP